MKEPVPFLVEVDDAHVRRERTRARELRDSPWWKRRRADGVCHHCGKRVGAKALTMDHVLPIIRGGRSTRGNVVPSCKECNSAKAHRLPFEFEAGAAVDPGPAEAVLPAHRDPAPAGGESPGEVDPGPQRDPGCGPDRGAG